MLKVAVRPKRDMDAQKIVNENDAARPECDEAAAVDEDAASKQARKEGEWHSSSSKKDTWRKWWGYKWRCKKLEGLLKKWEITARGEKQHLSEVSKQIRKCIIDKRRSKRQEKIQRILEEFRGIKNISCIESAKKRVLIPKV